MYDGYLGMPVSLPKIVFGSGNRALDPVRADYEDIVFRLVRVCLSMLYHR